MEGLGSAASIIAVIEVAAKLISLGNSYIGANSYICAVKRASDDIRDLTQELVALKQVLDILQGYAVRNPQWIALQKLSDKDGPLQRCKVELSRLQLKLEPKTGLKGVMKNLTWPFNQSETLQNISRIERHKSLFILALTADHIALSHAIEVYVRETDATVQEIKTDLQGAGAAIQDLKVASAAIKPCVENTNSAVQEIKTDVKDANTSIQHLKTESTAQALKRKKDEKLLAEEKRMEVLKWLYSDSFDKKHLEISHRRQKDTGGWLLKRIELQQLVEGRQGSQLLWGYGIPGVGKTFLSSGVVDYLQKEALTANYGVAYIYFDYQEQEQQKPDAVLSSLLKQITSQLKHLPTDIEKLYDDFKPCSKRPTTEELFITLVSASKMFSRTFFVFDALDECHQENQRRGLLPLLHRMGENGISLFLTSRQHPEDIQESFRNIKKIEITANERDIESYIEARIEENPRAKRLVQQGKCKEKIVSELVSCAKGMFLLVKFHVEYLCQQTTAKKVLNALEKLRTTSMENSSLDPTYDRVMKTILDQPKDCAELATKILSWLVNARRPLALNELQTAISIEPERYELDELDIPDPATILHVCAGLVMIGESDDNGYGYRFSLAPRTKTVRLVHYTVQEYLLKKTTVATSEDAKFHLAMACTTYLSFEIFAQDASVSWEPLDDHRSEHPFLGYADHLSRHPAVLERLLHDHLLEHPFLCYALEYLPFHLKACDEVLTTELVLQFLTSSSGISSYLRFLPICDLSKTSSSISLSSDSSPLHTASFLGHYAVVQLLLEGASPTIDSNDGRGPVTTTKRYDTSVQQLLSVRADISAEDEEGNTALSLAVAKLHELVVQLLLEKGANPSRANSSGRTFLHKAASLGNETIVKLLLEHGADPSASDHLGCTVLHKAVCKGNKPIVQLLLGKGANPSGADSSGRTPLHKAASLGNETMVKLLLEHGADPFASDHHGHTVLYGAVCEGNKPMVQLLLGKGANPSWANSSGRTLLHNAAFLGDETMVKLLLEHGADPSASDRLGHTVLYGAVCGGSESIVPLLLGKGANPSRATSSGRTPLHEAASLGNETIVKLLLEHGADPSASFHLGCTVLCEAVRGGNESIVKLLLEKGVNPSTAASSGRTPLYGAASLGNKTMVKLLLEHGADPSASDHHGCASLYQAVCRGNESVVQLLLKKGANPSRANSSGRTPLHKAASLGSETMVKLLLEHGADPSAPDHLGHTVLYGAVCGGNESIVQLLLEKGANTSTASWGQTLLHEATSQGSKVMVELLLNHGADSSIPDSRGHTALHDAVDIEHELIVQLLLEKGANPSAATPSGRIPLHRATYLGNEMIVKSLLEHNADLSALDAMGHTILYGAVLRGNESIVQRLLENGANPSTASWGRTPLHEASRRSKVIVKLLLDHGADPSTPDIVGRTPLDEAKSIGNEPILQLLSERKTQLSLALRTEETQATTCGWDDDGQERTPLPDESQPPTQNATEDIDIRKTLGRKRGPVAPNQEDDVPEKKSWH